MGGKIAWDLGSFRDPEGSVFLFNGSAYRTFTENSLPKIEKLLSTDFFQKYVEEKRIIKTTIIKNKFSKDNLVKGEYILQHTMIPFITYPYEWSFSMLKDGALLVLNLLKDCLQNGYILKDGTAWNVTYNNGKMIFFDVLSIDIYEEGQTWDGYNQFCCEFLYPLLLKSYKDIDFHNFFKGTLSGIEPRIAKQMFSIKDLLKPGVFKHVFLNAKFSENKRIASSTVKNIIKLPKQSLISIVNGLIKVIEGLKSKSNHSVWIDYPQNNTYEAQAAKQKADFIEKFCQKLLNNSTIIDLGCNTGTYSFITAKTHKVIASDIDSDCIDTIYKHENINDKSITPIVINLMNPSSSCGWALQERKSIFERLRVEGFLALALIHHICIANNVPLERFVSFLSQIASKGVLEWVGKEDPMVEFLLRNRIDVFQDYTWDHFEKSVSKYFKITDTMPLNNGTRILCALKSLTE